MRRLRGCREFLALTIVSVIAMATSLTLGVPRNSPPPELCATERLNSACLTELEAEVANDAERIGADIAQGLRRKYNIDELCSRRWVELVSDDGDDSGSAASQIMAEQCHSLLGEVLELVGHSHSRVRLRAVEILGDLGNKDVTSAVKARIADDDSRVAAAALRAYCRLDKNQCKPMVLDVALRSDDWRLRASGVEVASEVGYTFTAREILALLDDPLGDVRRRVLDQMSCEQLRERTVLGRVIELAKSRDWVSPAGRREYGAVRLLGRCKVASSTSHLMKILDNEERYHHHERGMESIIMALAEVGGEQARSAIESFVLAHSSDPGMAELVGANIDTPLTVSFEALGAVGGPSTVSAIRHGLRDPYYRVRLAALKTIERLRLVCELRDDINVLRDSDGSPYVVDKARSLLQVAARECPRSSRAE